MTITPWSDAAKALVGAAFGNPEMRAKEEEMQLKRDQFGLDQQKFGLDQQKYGLDEAYNPARIGQAEASAGFDRARTATEAITQAKSQIELDNILKFLEPDAVAPEMNYAPMPEFNPSNVGPQGQGRNPAMVLPYDQIQPLDALPRMPAVSDQEFAEFDVRALPPGPEVPFNPMTMGGDAPVTEGPDPFAQLIAGLTGAPTQVAPPNGAAYFEDLGSQQEPLRLDVPAMAPPAPTDIMTPEIRQMIAAGYLKPENIGDMILAAEGQGANRGVVDPSKRIANAAAGTGTFLSPDQVLAQALGDTRDTATLGNLAETSLGTADIQNFEYGQNNKGFTEYLAAKDAGNNLTVTNPDGTTIQYGKNASGKPLTEVQGKYALFGTRAAQAQQNLESVLSSDYGRDMGKLGFTNSVDFITGMSKPESASGALVNNAIMSPEGRQLYQSANSFLTAIVRPDSGAALTPDEWQIYGKIFIPMPGDDDATVAQKRLDRQIATTALQGLSSGGAAQVAQLLQNKGVPVPKELQVYLNQAPAAAQSPAAAPVRQEMTDANGNRAIVEVGADGTMTVVEELQ